MPHENDPGSQNPGQQASPEEAMGNMVNAAVKAHLQRFTEKVLPGILQSSIEQAVKPLSDKLTAPPPSEDESAGKSKKGKQDPELLAMAQQLESMKKAIEQEQAKAAAAEKAAREQKAYSELRRELEGKVRPDMVDFVAKHLMVVDQRIEFDETGSVLFKSQKPAYPGGDFEEFRLPLRAGLEDFLKSDGAKPFLPAPSTSSAAPLPKRSAPASGPDFSKPAASDSEKVARAAERVRQAEARLGKQ